MTVCGKVQSLVVIYESRFTLRVTVAVIKVILSFTYREAFLIETCANLDFSCLFLHVHT